MSIEEQSGPISRRQFLRQSFAFSALAAGLGSGRTFAWPSGTQTPDTLARHALLVGDWGWGGSLDGQTQTAHAMVAYAQAHKLKSEALFMLGDSWYGAMPGGVKDPRWQLQFEDMYPKSAFDCPAYSVMGNHDYQRIPHDVTKTTMELDYAKSGGADGKGTRWTQPALWYTYQFPQVNPVMTVIALDSNMPGRHFGTDFTLTEEQRVEQLAWFKEQLARPRTTPFLAVIAHHPVFSNGPHGDHKTLIADWEPLLREHKVDFYFAGHDHDLQHLEFEGHPTSFVCSGAGGADLYDLTIPESQRGPYAEKVYGFSHLEATPDRIILRHIAANGRLVHSFAKDAHGKVTLGV